MNKDTDKMVVDNIKLVNYTLGKYFSRYRNNEIWEDLYQEGCLALIGAVKKFDRSLNITFSTYAVAAIRGCINNHIKRKCNILKAPRVDLEDAHKIVAVQFKYGDDLKIDFISEKTGIPEDRIERLIRDVITPPTSLSCVWVNSASNKSLTAEDCISDGIDYFKPFFDKEEITWVLKPLTELEKKAVIMYYYYDMTQTEIAKVLNTNQVTVSRYLGRAKSKIRGEYSERHSKTISVDCYDLQGNFVKNFKSMQEAGRYFNIPPSYVSKCCRGELKKTADHVFKLKEVV